MGYKDWQKDPEFQALPQAQKFKLYAAHFDANVAANPQFSGLPKERQAAARRRYMGEVMPELGGGQGAVGSGQVLDTDHSTLTTAFKDFSKKISRSSNDSLATRRTVSAAPVVGARSSYQPEIAPAPKGPGVLEQGARNMMEAVGSLEGVRAEDIGRSLGVGLSRTGQLLGRGLDVVGLDSAGQAVESYYKGREQEHRGKLSEAFQREKGKEFIEVDPATGKYKMGKAWTSLPKILSTIVESAPSTALGMGTGMGFTAGLTKLGVSSGLAGIIGGALGEGGMAGAESAKTAYDTVIDAPIEQLSQTKEFKEAWNEAKGLPPDQRMAAARKAVASTVAMKTGGTVGALTGVLGAPSGHFMGKALGGETGKTMLRTALKQAGLETLQEMPQSAAERLVQNITEKQYVDPDKNIWEGVGEAMAEGGVSGFAMGFGMGGGSHVMGGAQTEASDQQAEAGDQEAAPPPNPAPMGSNAAEVTETGGQAQDVGQAAGPAGPQGGKPAPQPAGKPPAPMGSNAAEITETGGQAQAEQGREQEQDQEQEEGLDLSPAEVTDALSVIGTRMEAGRRAEIEQQVGGMGTIEDVDAAFPGVDAASMYAKLVARNALPRAAAVDQESLAPDLDIAQNAEQLQEQEYNQEQEQELATEPQPLATEPQPLAAEIETAPMEQIEQVETPIEAVPLEGEQGPVVADGAALPADDIDLGMGPLPAGVMPVEQYSVKPQESGVTAEDVREVFKGAPVESEADGSFRVKLGRRDLTIRNVERIDVNEAAFQLGYGRRISTAEKAAGAAGAYKDGEIRISRAGDRWTLHHETYHFLETSGFLNQQEIDALDRAIGWGRRTVTQEDRAMWVEEALKQRAEGRRGIVGRVLQKLGDLVDGFANLVRRTDRGVLRDIESGRAYNQNLAPDLTLDPAQNIEQEQEYEQEQDQADQAEQAEQYKLAPVYDEVFDIDQDTAGDKVRKAAQSAREAARLDNVKEGFDKKITQMVDRLNPLKKLGDLPYKLERMATGKQSLLEMFFKHGTNIEYEGMAPTIRTENQGAEHFFKSLGEDLYPFLGWVAAKRADQIDQQDMNKYAAEVAAGQTNLTWNKWRDKFGRVEKRLTPERRAKIYQDTAAGPKNAASWEEINDKFMEINRDVIEFAVKSEHMSRDTADRLLKADFFLPFYRVLNDEKLQQQVMGGPRGSGKNIDAVIKEYTGSDKKIADPLANIMKNWSAIISASVDNVSRAAAFDSAVGQQITVTDMDGRQVPILQQMTLRESMETKDKDMVMSFQRLGKRHYFKVNDAELFAAMTNNNKVDNYISKVFGGAKRMATFGATVVPVFRLRNGMRDTLHVAVTSRSFLPFIDTMKGMWSVWKEDADYIAYMASCAGFGNNYISAEDPLASAKYINKMAKRAGKKSLILDTPRKLWELYEKFGEAMESGARVEIYKKRRAEGKSHLDAAFEGRDLLDFTMRGDSKAIQYLIQTVPFMNARIQGLYKLGTSFKENPMGFAVKGGLTALASLALWAHNRDDERYKALEDWQKRTYYHFWTPNGYHIVFPKPFEVGAIFSTTFEAAADAFAGDEDIEYFVETLKHTALETFSMNPLPQLIKPALEVTMNKSFFTGRAIDSPADERLPAGERGSYYTSETMRTLGEKFGFSPKRGEALVRGYLASFGRDMLSLSDIFFRNFGDFPIDPTPRLEDTYFLGDFIKAPGPARNTKYMQRFYDASSEINQVASAVSKYRYLGDMEKVRKYMAQPAVKFKRIAGRTQRELGELSRRMRRIYAARNMSAEEKRAQLDSLAERKNRLVRQFYERWREKN